jgi:hypothetical protein
VVGCEVTEGVLGCEETEGVTGCDKTDGVPGGLNNVVRDPDDVLRRTAL